MHYPQTHIMLHGNNFLSKVQPLRDKFDFGYCSDHQIADGGLGRFRVLILLWGHVAETETWEAILSWVREGGLLMAAEGNGPLLTVEQSLEFQEALLSPDADTGKGRVMLFPGEMHEPQYRKFITATLAHAKELSSSTRGMIRADGRENHVFAAATGPGQLLWFNGTDRAVRCMDTAIPPHAIKTTRISSRIK